MSKKRRPSFPRAVADAVLERALDHCEACDWPAAGKMDMHHRLLRSQGGQDTVENLIWVHHLCHVLAPYSIHQNPARSYQLGHMVRSGLDPAQVPVVAVLDLRERTGRSGLNT